MAWNGYWQYDGMEIINAPRTEAYLLNAQKGWFIPTFNKPEFAAQLNHADWTDPANDAAPWYDPDIPASGEFYGFYPLDISGAESSSRGASPIEFTIDGGFPGLVRHATKAVVFNGLLMAESEESAEYGMRWLRRALLGNACGDDGTTPTNTLGLGVEMIYFAYEPDVEPDGDTFYDEDWEIGAVQALRPALRQFRNASGTTGPTVMAKRKMSCGGQIWSVQFTVTVGNPWEFGLTQQYLQGYLDPSVTDPWVAGVTPGVADDTPTNFVDVDCGTDVWTPVYDPECPALIVPPTPPSVPLGCATLPSTFSRYQVTIPGENVRVWGDSVPVVTLSAGADPIRNVRIRFYPDPTSTLDPWATPCGFVGDFVVSYIPALGSMTIDGITETVSVLTAEGHRRRADSLVYSSKGAPLDWPALHCGYGWIMTVDVDPAGDTPVVGLGLATRSR